MTYKLIEMMIDKLKGDINTLQAEALEASRTGDLERCSRALKLQSEAISDLIKISETYNRNYK